MLAPVTYDDLGACVACCAALWTWRLQQSPGQTGAFCSAAKEIVKDEHAILPRLLPGRDILEETQQGCRISHPPPPLFTRACWGAPGISSTCKQVPGWAPPKLGRSVWATLQLSGALAHVGCCPLSSQLTKAHPPPPPIPPLSPSLIPFTPSMVYIGTTVCFLNYICAHHRHCSL